MKRILYYVSGHGFGHISRSYAIIQALLEREDISHITLVSGRVDFVKEEHPKLEKRRILMDVGVYQKDSISLDVEKTRFALEEFEKEKNHILEGEIAFARQGDYDLILSDSASLPLVLGVELRIPALFVGNFTWDFIYKNFEKYDPYFGVIAHILKVEYSFATACVQLPFACPMEGFLETHKVGLVGRKPRLDKKSAREKFGLEVGKTYFLFSFGAYGLEGMEWNWTAKSADTHIIVNNVPGIREGDFLDIECDYYPDLMTACDYIVTKPGFGIINESILSNTPIIYTDRGDFAEYPYLVDELEEMHPASFISREDLLNFRFSSAVDEIAEKRLLKKTKSYSNGIVDFQKLINQYL